MRDPTFLDLKSVLALHAGALEEFGGSDGVLNMSLLESAIQSPQASWGGKYLNLFPFEMAAAYLYSLARNHAFADGNKRTAFLAAAAFLHLNGYTLEEPAETWKPFMVAVAAGDRTKKAIAATLQESAARR